MTDKMDNIRANASFFQRAEKFRDVVCAKTAISRDQSRDSLGQIIKSAFASGIQDIGIAMIVNVDKSGNNIFPLSVDHAAAV